MKKIEESQPEKDKEEEQVKINKKLKLKMESLNSKITDLTVDLTAVKKAKLLSDNEVRHRLLFDGSRHWKKLKKVKQKLMKILSKPLLIMKRL